MDGHTQAHAFAALLSLSFFVCTHQIYNKIHTYTFLPEQMRASVANTWSLMFHCRITVKIFSRSTATLTGGRALPLLSLSLFQWFTVKPGNYRPILILILVYIHFTEPD